MPNVPQLVPVEKLSTPATMKMIAGRKLNSDPAAEFMTEATKYLPPSRPVMFLSEVAKVRIMMAGTMLMNPFGRQSMAALKLMRRRHRK